MLRISFAEFFFFYYRSRSWIPSNFMLIQAPSDVRLLWLRPVAWGGRARKERTQRKLNSEAAMGRAGCATCQIIHHEVIDHFLFEYQSLLGSSLSENQRWDFLGFKRETLVRTQCDHLAAFLLFRFNLWCATALLAAPGFFACWDGTPSSFVAWIFQDRFVSLGKYVWSWTI